MQLDDFQSRLMNDKYFWIYRKSGLAHVVFMLFIIFTKADAVMQWLALSLHVHLISAWVLSDFLQTRAPQYVYWTI